MRAPCMINSQAGVAMWADLVWDDGADQSWVDDADVKTLSLLVRRYSRDVVGHGDEGTSEAEYYRTIELPMCTEDGPAVFNNLDWV